MDDSLRGCQGSIINGMVYGMIRHDIILLFFLALRATSILGAWSVGVCRHIFLVSWRLVHHILYIFRLLR